MQSMRGALSKKEHRIIRDGLIAQGCTVRESTHNFLYTRPDGRTAGVAKTASDWRSTLNSRADVRRIGLHWPLDPPPRLTRRKPMTAAPVIDLAQREITARDRAIDWLRRWMGERDGAPTTEIKDAARTVRGFGERALTEAMKDIGVRSKDGSSGAWTFHLNAEGGKTAAELLAEIRRRESASAQVEQPVDEVRTVDEDAALALAEEAQAEVESLRRKLRSANERIAQMQEHADAEPTRRAQLIGDKNRAIQDLSEAVGEIAQLRREVQQHERRSAALELATTAAVSQAPVRMLLPAGNDGSWVLSDDEVGDQTLSALTRGARTFGLTIEVRARRA